MAVLKKIKLFFLGLNLRLDRFIPVTTPLSIVIGFLFPSVFVNFLPLVPLLFGIMTFSGALKLRLGELGASVRPIPILLFFAVAHVFMPLIAMFVSSLFFDNPDLVSGFVLLFSGPTAVSGFIWISILKGDMALCLTLILFDTLLAPIVVPGTLQILMGARVAMDISGIAFSLFLMVVLPTIFGVGINEISKGKIPKAICSYLDPFAKISLMAVIAINASVIVPYVSFSDPLIWKVAFFVILLIFAGFYLMKLAAALGKFHYPKNITLIMSGGLRNNSAIMTIAVSFFPPIAVLPALASILVQQVVAAIMGKCLKRRETAEPVQK